MDTEASAAAHGTALTTTNASEKTLLVLEAAFSYSRFTDIVEATGLPKATTHRILATLLDRQFVTVNKDGGYLPGPKILSLAGRALERIDISAIAQPHIDALVERVHCTVHLGAGNGDEVLYLVRTDSDTPYRMPSRVGHSIPMHSSGIGKVILASYSDDALERFVARAGLERRTDRTLTTLPDLEREITQVRQVGYALDREENVPGVICVAAPVYDHTGTVKYGVSISTITLQHTEDQIEAMSPEAIATANAISEALGYTPH